MKIIQEYPSNKCLCVCHCGLEIRDLQDTRKQLARELAQFNIICVSPKNGEIDCFKINGQIINTKN